MVAWFDTYRIDRPDFLHPCCRVGNLMMTWILMTWMIMITNLCSDQAWSTATLTTWDLSSSQVKSLSQVPGFERLTVAYSDLCKVRWAGTPYAKISRHVNHWYLASRVWGPTSLPTTTSLPFTVNLTSSSTPWVKFAMLSSLFSGQNYQALSQGRRFRTHVVKGRLG